MISKTKKAGRSLQEFILIHIYYLGMQAGEVGKEELGDENFLQKITIYFAPTLLTFASNPSLKK